MKKRTEKLNPPDDLRREYNLSELGKGVRGKYLARFQSNTKPVIHLKKRPPAPRRLTALN